MKITSNDIEFDIWELFADAECKACLVFDEYDIAEALNEAARSIDIPGLSSASFVDADHHGRMSVLWTPSSGAEQRWTGSSKHASPSDVKDEAPFMVRCLIEKLNKKTLTLVNSWSER